MDFDDTIELRNTTDIRVARRYSAFFLYKYITYIFIFLFLVIISDVRYVQIGREKRTAFGPFSKCQRGNERCVWFFVLSFFVFLLASTLCSSASVQCRLVLLTFSCTSVYNEIA